MYVPYGMEVKDSNCNLHTKGLGPDDCVRNVGMRDGYSSSIVCDVPGGMAQISNGGTTNGYAALPLRKSFNTVVMGVCWVSIHIILGSIPNGAGSMVMWFCLYSLWGPNSTSLHSANAKKNLDGTLWL